MPKGVEHWSEIVPMLLASQVPLAVMPKGVEHRLSWRFTPNFISWVPLAVMPKGVEHLTGKNSWYCGSAVPLAVMPKGVEHEHTLDVARRMKGSPGRDAERR